MSSVFLLVPAILLRRCRIFRPGSAAELRPPLRQMRLGISKSGNVGSDLNRAWPAFLHQQQSNCAYLRLAVHMAAAPCVRSGCGKLYSRRRQHRNRGLHEACRKVKDRPRGPGYHLKFIPIRLHTREHSAAASARRARLWWMPYTDCLPTDRGCLPRYLVLPTGE